jgi:hypothetical protein
MQNSSDINHMDQKSIVQYLAGKELSLREISSDLEVTVWVEIITINL